MQLSDLATPIDISLNFSKSNFMFYIFTINLSI